MMRFRHWALIGGGLLAGCATEPSGPGVLVLPGAGKTFEEFREEDAVCRNDAQDRVGTSPEQAADDSVPRGAGASDALIGAGSHDAGVGAAIGAGNGAAGSAAAGTVADAVQARYDLNYLRCMDAKGNRVPPPSPGPPGHPLPPPPTLPPPPRLLD